VNPHTLIQAAPAAAPCAPRVQRVDGGRLSRLVDAAYAASADPDAWPALLAEAAQLIEADRVHVVSDGGLDLARLGLQHGFTPDELERYRRDCARVDPWRRPAGALAPGRSATLRCEDLVDAAVLLDSDAYRDFYAPLGMRWFIGCAVAPETAGAPLYVVRFFRGAQGGPFDADDEFVLGELGRHLLRIERLAARALGRDSPVGVARPATFVLSVSGQLVQCDAAGAALLAGGALRRAALRLRFAAPAADAWLASALAVLSARKAARRQLRQVGVESADVESQVELLALTPPNSSPLMVAARYLLRVSTVHTCTREQATRDASARYGWTEAEFDVALRLGNGGTIAAIAKSRGTTLDTVRSHVKSIKRKTGVRRVADLIRVIAELTDGLRLAD